MRSADREETIKRCLELLSDLAQIAEVGFNSREIVFKGHLNEGVTPEDIRNRLKFTGYSAKIADYNDFQVIRISKRGFALDLKSTWINILLFIITVFTTLFAGSIMEGGDPLNDFSSILRGIPFSFTLMAILGFHELGHYFASRRNNVKATLPYFIPAPTLIGTFGAFIKMKSPIYNRKSLMEIGAAGPLAGFAVALPALIYGLSNSQIIRVTPGFGIKLGDSLLIKILSKMIFGTLPEGYDILLSSVAFAGWIGLLVTALNLLPIGQLDGGHIGYALFGKKHDIIAKVAFIAILPLAFFSEHWIIWAALIFFLIRIKHPPILDYGSPLDFKHKLMGWVSFVIFILCFIPDPISM